MIDHKEIQLPTSWEKCTLESIVRLNPTLDKSRLDDSMDVSFVPMPAVEAENGRIDVSQTRTLGEVKKGYTAFQERDVLFAKITPCMENGKMAIAPKLTGGLGFGSTEFHVLRCYDDISPEYIYYFVSSRQLRLDAEHNMTGAVGQKRVPTPWLSQVEVPIPPLNEQRRIVAKIEELFSELDKAVECLKTAREQLKVYRQALLKHAFEGKLTEQWRRDNADKLESADELLARIQRERETRYEQQVAEWKEAVKRWEAEGRVGKKPGKPRVKQPETLLNSGISSFPKLPSNWLCVGIRETGLVQLGRQRSPKQMQGAHIRPYLRVANVRLERIDTTSVHAMNFTPEEYETFSLAWGDILLNEGQSLELIGRPAMYKDEVPGSCFQNTLVRYRASSHVNPMYALKLFVYFFHFGVFQKIAKWTNNIAHLGGGRFAELPFPLCVRAEQDEIVRILDNKLSSIDKTEGEIADSIKKCEALRQSILKKAFSGQLVPQDPDDEPASVLLERIAAEKAARAGEKVVKAKAPRGTAPRAKVSGKATR